MFGTGDILAVEGGGGFYHLLLPSLPDLIWGTLAFVFVATVIHKFAWPTFIQTLDERTEKIENGLKAAEIARAEIASERENLAAEIVDAQREAALVREKAQDNAKAIVSEAQRKARLDAVSIVDAAKKRISADTEAANRTLKSDLGSLATDLAGKILGEAVTDQALASRVIDRFLDELAETLPAKSVSNVQEH
ncbi:F0F1 ATP synthase subunit B [Arcanobacterium hippocoleae]